MYLVIDQGTTSTKVTLFGEDGKRVDSSQKTFKQIFPQSGWVEHDPKEIIESVIFCFNDVIKRNNDASISSLGITNQRETVVLWNKLTGEHLYNAIVWQDRRTEKKCKELKEKNLEEIVNKKTGLLLDPYFSSTKIAWIIDNVDGVRDKINKDEVCAGTIDSWIIWNLTKGEIFAMGPRKSSRGSTSFLIDTNTSPPMISVLTGRNPILSFEKPTGS